MTRVLLNASPLYTGRAGVARYVRGLCSGLETLSDQVVMEQLAWPVSNYDKPQPFRAMVTAFRDLVWRRVVPRLKVAIGDCDVVHDTISWWLPEMRRVATVATVHDAAMLRHPERFRRWHRHSSLKGFHAAKNCDRIIAISRFSADEIVSLGSFDPRKIQVVHNGCDFVEGNVPEETQPVGFDPEPFFLFVGSLEPGKNLELLRKVYELAASRRVELPRLRIVGARWPGVEREGRPPGQWTYQGHVPDSELVYLYRRALALVFPSKYEGFGLPLVEAMSLGCPVLCSPVASLPEVGGDAVLYAEQQPEAYLESMRALLASEARSELIDAGARRSVRFSWRRCAEETADVYREAMRVCDRVKG